MPSHELQSSPARVLASLRCPRCGAGGLAGETARTGPEPPTRTAAWPTDGALRCPTRHTFGIWRGVPDFASAADGGGGGGQPEVRPTPFQRLMQFSPVVSIYERWWRPLGFRIASGWDLDEAMAELMRLCEPYRHVLVVDLACGPGNYTRALWRHGAPNVVGVDLSAEMLDRALAESRGMGLSFVRASALDLPFVDESIDAVCCAGALHLFEDPDRAIREIARVLVPGGVLVGQTVIRPGTGAAALAADLLAGTIRFGFFRDVRELEARLAAGGLLASGGTTRGIAHLFKAVRGATSA